VRLPKEQLIAVDESASAHGVTVSELIRDAIDAYVRMPRITVSMAFHGTSTGELRLAGTNIEFASVPARTQVVERQYGKSDPDLQLPLLTG
jgi:hypothetical protein